jgi:high-affinity iron transporter
MEPAALPYFLYSLGILVREGLEALLVIIALAASVRNIGAAGKVRGIYLGSVLAIGASLILAWVVYDLIGDNASDTLEGIFQILAAATLFWVSSWLTSKTQAERWNSYILGRIQNAERSGLPSFALGLTAFLAVIREGAETILFFQALLAGATEAIERHAVEAGMVAGAVALSVACVVLHRAAARIPIRSFFSATSVLLYVLAVVFVGQGIASLQEAGVVRASFVSYLPTVGVLGVYPTLQSLTAQGLLLIFAAAAILRPRGLDGGIELRSRESLRSAG